ncbi:YhdP family protein [Paraferrimonas haliotis]|uniref:DUF3971 domain-containing protein n=1 Tax=Paraferrimonas haliotis TaxID=2013866 RepID=A0AA37TSN2_9GAMM|nr:YhdP family protein [Paraferrimonas haliotis]GLS82359.1 DUF3971 domain-containing protein [Paraferrimonas haliotis]
MAIQFLSKLTRQLGIGLAIVLVLFALTVSLVRGLLPQLNQLKADVENYIASQYHVNIEIGSMEAAWAAYGPELTINELVIPQQSALPVSMTVDKIHLKLDFWQTLVTATPQVEDVGFDGLKFELDLDILDSPTSQGNSDWLYALLLEQLDRYSITEAQVTLKRNNKRSNPIYLSEFKWLNKGLNHKGSGYIGLDADPDNDEQLRLSVQMRGNGFDPDNLKGEFYVAAEQLDLGKWHPGALQQELQLTGLVNFELWSRFNNRAFQTAILEFSPSQLQWQYQQQPQTFEIRSGVLQWLPNQQGWQMTSRDFDIVSNNQAWQDFGVFINASPQQFGLFLNRIDLANLEPFLPLIPGIKLAHIEQWMAMSPSGTVSKLQLQKAKDGEWLTGVQGNGLSWNAFGNLPEVADLQLVMASKGDIINAELPKQSIRFGMPSEGIPSANYQLESTGLAWQQTDAGSQLLIPRLQLQSDLLTLDARAALLLTEEQSPLLSLSASAAISDVAKVEQLFPKQAMGMPLSNYLGAALVKGKIADANIVWQGRLGEFPYDDKQGTFQAGFQLQKGEFEFQPDWPAVSELTLDALFEDARMDLNVVKGKLLNVDADGAFVGIERLQSQSQLRVIADLTAQGADVTDVMVNSALSGSVGKTLEVVEINGPIRANIDLDIPLYPEGELLAKGDVYLKDTPVYVNQPGMQLDEMSGTVSFENAKVTAQELQAKLYGQPTQITIDADNLNDDYGVSIKLNGSWQVDELPPKLDNALTDYYSGQLDWRGRVRMVFDDTGFRIQAQVNSDLEQAVLTLPEPLAKPLGASRQLRAELIGDSKQLFLGVKYDDAAEFWAGFDEEHGAQIAHYDLMVGRLFKLGDNVRRRQGHINIQLAEADFGEWLPVIQSFIQDIDKVEEEVAAKERTPLFPALTFIQGDFKSFDIFGAHFSDLNLVAEPDNNFWQVLANSPQVDAGLTFYPNWSEQGLKLVASKLHIAPQFDDADEQSVDHHQIAESLPPLALDIDDFKLYDYHLGHVVMQASPVDEGYQIQALRINDDYSSLNGRGMWYHKDRNQTELEFDLTAKQFDELTRVLNISPGVKDSPLSTQATLSWNGAPYSPDVASLNGKVSFEMGKGHLSQVSDKGTRIFSLFSLESLVRKLSLDFTDVFGKGFYYNKFSGDLDLKDGIVNTDNAVIDGTAGLLKVKGYTNLLDDSIDYDVRFSPHLASSVPTVVLLTTSAWNLGIGAFAISKVLQPVIEVISEIRFRLTGTIYEPLVNETGRKSKEIEVPESILPKTEPEQGVESEGKPTADAVEPEV